MSVGRPCFELCHKLVSLAFVLRTLSIHQISTHPSNINPVQSSHPSNIYPSIKYQSSTVYPSIKYLPIYPCFGSFLRTSQELHRHGLIYHVRFSTMAQFLFLLPIRYAFFLPLRLYSTHFVLCASAVILAACPTWTHAARESFEGTWCLTLRRTKNPIPR